MSSVLYVPTGHAYQPPACCVLYVPRSYRGTPGLAAWGDNQRTAVRWLEYAGSRERWLEYRGTLVITPARQVTRENLSLLSLEILGWRPLLAFCVALPVARKTNAIILLLN